MQNCNESFNTKFGDLSAILIENLPFWVEITTVPTKNFSVRMGNQGRKPSFRKLKQDVGS